jgi:mono/diheme cytochrome c family protein
MTGRRRPSSSPALAAVLLLLTACQEDPAAPTGGILFLRHCAACHGTEAGEET